MPNDAGDPPPSATLHALPGGGSPDKLAEILRQVKASADVMIEYHQIDARIQRARFKSLVDAGFTEAQALELVKVR